MVDAELFSAVDIRHEVLYYFSWWRLRQREALRECFLPEDVVIELAVFTGSDGQWWPPLSRRLPPS